MACRYPLGAADTYSLGGLALRFDNRDEVTALRPGPELLASLEKGSGREATVVYVPVGAYDDPLKGGQGVMGHIVSVDTVDMSTGRRRVFSTKTASHPMPWQGPKQDERLAADFDVAGLRTGMAPRDVVRIAASELGQRLAYNEEKSEVRSAPADCDFEFRRDRTPPPLGRRCLVTSFAKVAGTAGWSSVKFQLTQTVPTDQSAKTEQALAAKYGKPDFAGAYEGKLTLSDLEGVDTPKLLAVVWGARLAVRRPERDGVPFPPHPLELTTKVVGAVTVMTLNVVDWAAITARAEAASAAAKRTSDAVTPKF